MDYSDAGDTEDEDKTLLLTSSDFILTTTLLSKMIVL